MREVKVPRPKSESFTHQLECFYGVFQNVPVKSDIYFDLSNVNWVTPVVLLPIAAHLRGTRGNYKIPNSKKVKNYLKSIRFPMGANTLSALQNPKSFIPISLIRSDKGLETKSEVLYCFLSLIHKTVNRTQLTKNAFFYSPTELVNNIFEHSGKNYGLVFAQTYSSKGYLDICIVDTGRGLAKSFEGKNGGRISDCLAIQMAMSGESTKPGTDRGFGLRTSKKMICKGFNGEFTLISGNACLLSNNTEDKLFQLPGINWQGVILAARLPFPKAPVEYLKYIE